MTSYASFEELEASVPLSQLRPSVAFSRCSAHLPYGVDQLRGDELVQSLEAALVLHSKARVVLQCWVLLIMRRGVDGARHEKDALYARVQQRAVTPQERTRYRRGAMLLCHLLIERAGAAVASLLDRYLVDFYFPWSTAVNDRDDAFYLQADVVRWVREALEYMDQNGEKMAAARWLELSRSSVSPTAATGAFPSAAQTMAQASAPQRASSGRESEVSSGPTVERTSPPQVSGTSERSSISLSHQPVRASIATQHWSPPPSIAYGKRRRVGTTQRTTAVNSTITSETAAYRELETLKEAIEQWARRLRRRLLRAARTGDTERIRQIADELQAPPLQGCDAGDDRGEPQTDGSSSNDDDVDDDSADDDGKDDDQPPTRKPRAGRSLVTTDSDSSIDSPVPSKTPDYCTVCEEEPKRVEQVWNGSCQHGCCGVCMLAWLSQRKRQCMQCRAKILQVVDGSGEVFHHYDWTKWWKRRVQAEHGAGVKGVDGVHDGQ